MVVACITVEPQCLQWVRVRMFYLARLLLLNLAILAVGVRSLSADPVPAFANETVLVMVDDKACVYCAKWDREVSAAYMASPEGKFAPLERRTKGHRDLNGLPGLRFTPTFVLLERGREVGRIIGYGGDDQFWGELDRLLSKTDFGTQKAPTKPSWLEETGLEETGLEETGLRALGRHGLYR
jgi:hypothetical protein